MGDFDWQGALVSPRNSNLHFATGTSCMPSHANMWTRLLACNELCETAGMGFGFGFEIYLPHRFKFATLLWKNAIVNRHILNDFPSKIFISSYSKLSSCAQESLIRTGFTPTIAIHTLIWILNQKSKPRPFLSTWQSGLVHNSTTSPTTSPQHCFSASCYNTRGLVASILLQFFSETWQTCTN